MAATGDFDNDGHDDLLLGSPDNDMVVAYEGSSGGLGTSARRTFTQDTPGVPGVTEPSDFFGEGVAAGDVDGDGYDDIAVGAEYETVGSVPNASSVTILRGSPASLTGTGAQAIHQDTAGVPGANEPYDRFGSAVRLTDTNRDGRADLAAGAPMENTSNGALWSLRGSPTGVTSTQAVSFSAATAASRRTRTSTSDGHSRPAAEGDRGDGAGRFQGSCSAEGNTARPTLVAVRDACSGAVVPDSSAQASSTSRPSCGNRSACSAPRERLRARSRGCQSPPACRRRLFSGEPSPPGACAPGQGRRRPAPSPRPLPARTPAPRRATAATGPRPPVPRSREAASSPGDGSHPPEDPADAVPPPASAPRSRARPRERTPRRAPAP
ncbi:FG-GAP-like repeat-containing protein [Actinomadura keratinilytica]